MARRPEAPPSPPSPFDDAVNRLKFSLEAPEPQIGTIIQDLIAAQTTGFQTMTPPEKLFSELGKYASQAEGIAREAHHPDFSTLKQMAEGYKAAAGNFVSKEKDQRELTALPAMTAPKS